MNNLEGRVAIITGGAMGMGNGSAKVLASRGAKVALVDYSSKVREAAETLQKEGYDVSAYQADVRDIAKLQEIYQTVFYKYGRIDILVNAAGIGSQKMFAEVSGDYLDHYLAVNFKGVWNSCQAAIPYMVKANYGKVVNFASVTGILVVDPGMTAYAATKGVIMAFTKALAVEYASNNITVNAILPGMIDTPMTDESCREACPENPQSIKDAIAAQIPMGRLGTAEEAGKVVAFLASDDSSYVTGTHIVFDGGNTIPETPGTGWKPS
jgi:NAD(P)-dependent dehydrogenase (short-subunit alcohol dehydrogenase family)